MTRRAPLRVPVLLWIGASLLAAPAARAAEPSAADQAAADALFNEARALVAAGRVAEGCAKFEGAQRLEPTVGTQMNLADCYERLGRTASAYGLFQDAEASARRAGEHGRQGEILKRARALEPKLSKLTILVAPNRPPGLEVKRDGQPVLEAIWGSAIPVDPGEHAIEASAPGRVSWQGTATVRPETAFSMIEIPELAAAPALPAEGGAARGALGAQRIAGMAVGGVGVAGVIVGAILGLREISRNNASKAQCSPSDPNFCNDAGVSLRHDARVAGTVSTAAFAVGGAAVVGAVVLVLTAPSAKPASKARIVVVPRVAGGDVGLTLEGKW
jgi:hypothetical protein